MTAVFVTAMVASAGLAAWALATLWRLQRIQESQVREIMVLLDKATAKLASIRAADEGYGSLAREWSREQGSTKLFFEDPERKDGDIVLDSEPLPLDEDRGVEHY